MSELLRLAPALVAGVVLGGFFFGGLWWTVRKGVSSRKPGRWFLVSLALRLSVVLVGFYFVSGGRWERMLACLAGFIAGRLIVTMLTRPSGERGTRPEKEARRAP